MAITAGYQHNAALKSNGTVVAWGVNNAGQSDVPAGLSGVVAIAAGSSHTLALKNDETVAAWGYNGSGQVTVTPTTISPYAATANPVRIVGFALREVVAIAAGHAHTVALQRLAVSKPAAASAQVVNGFVVGVLLTGRGFGYTNAPAVRIVGGGGAGAVAQAVVKDGVVTTIQVLNTGSGYTGTPTVEIDPPPLPTPPSASISVSRVAVEMKLAKGFRYQVEASKDLSVWSPAGPPFVAASENVTQEFVVAETGQFFRVRPVP